MMNRIHLFYFLIFCSLFAKAQTGYERLSPFYPNPPQDDISEKRTVAETRFKTTTLFPFSSTFSRKDALDSLWNPSGVTLQHGSVVFNAIDSTGNVYITNPGNVDTCDVLTSKEMLWNPGAQQIWIQFTYSTGSTWSSTEILSLCILKKNGQYQHIWQSTNIPAQLVDVTVAVPVDSINTSDFEFRFILTGLQNTTQTESFLLHECYAYERLTPAFNEDFLQFRAGENPAPTRWLKSTTLIRTSGPLGTYAAAFDALNDTLGFFPFISDSTRYTDTLQSYAFNLATFTPSDSLWFRFFYKGINLQNTDSLVLQWKLASGMWSTVWMASGNSASDFIAINVPLNGTVWRHGLFQFRFMSKLYLDTSAQKSFEIGGIQLSEKLYVPFVEDFSSSAVRPDTRKWLSRSTFINQTFAKNPPSTGVATFDGLNAQAVPYGFGRGYCDTLLSKSLNLSGLQRSDSVILSFYIQPKGWGEAPNGNDSLMLEIRINPANNNQYRTLWSSSAANLSRNEFTRVDIILLDTALFHDDVQFLFKNIASRTGNTNHWHVDYIRLDKGRTRNDAFRDVAITNHPSSLLKPYYSMPYRHFSTNPANFSKQEQRQFIINHFNSPTPVLYSRIVKNEANITVDSFANPIPNFPALSDTSALFTTTVPMATSGTEDTSVFTSRYRCEIINSTDNIPTNDQVSVNTLFSNFFAYDDGTAESGYGIDLDVGAVALGYNLELPDTLQGIAIHFNRAFEDVSNRSFDLMVWSAIATRPNGTGETVLKRLALQAPQYFFQYNGFHYFKFDQPIMLPAGKFYIGWEQSQIYNLNVGWDENFELNGQPSVNPELAYRIQDLWRSSTLQGTPMMRPIVGKWISPPTSVHSVSDLDTRLSESLFELWPNPASDVIYINMLSSDIQSLNIRDMQGRVMIRSEENVIYLHALTNGVYFVEVESKSGYRQTKKIIVTK